MSNTSLLETIENQISDVEGKLQKMAKHNVQNEDMKEWLKVLHEKRKEILLRIYEYNDSKNK